MGHREANCVCKSSITCMDIRAVVAMGLHTATFASVFLRAPHCLTAQLKVGNAQCTSIGFRQRQGATSCGEVVGHWAALEGGRATEGQCSIGKTWQIGLELARFAASMDPVSKLPSRS